MAASVLSIRRFEELQVGDEATLTRTLTTSDVDAFAALSGDVNPLHMEDDFARAGGFRGRVVHGVLLASFVSTMVGMHLPGTGSLWTQQSFKWRMPVYIGDTITITLRITFKSEGTRTVSMVMTAVNQSGITVMEGEGAVKLPEQKASQQQVSMKERVALVTGASRGIGSAIATALAQAGAAVAVNYRTNAADAGKLCETLEAEGCRTFAVQADVTSRESVRNAVEAVASRFGRPVDLLINNAGSAPRGGALVDTEWNIVQEALDVHLKGAYNCCQSVVPGMLERTSGIIINLGAAGSGQQMPLAVAKSALRALTRSLAQELGPKGIRVNMVSPGLVDTASSEVPERARKLQAMQTPLRRLCSPEDVAQTVLFLCSDSGRLITGADIPVSGGLSPV